MTDNLVSDWTLGAFKAREDKRRLLELAEASGLATIAARPKPIFTSHSGELAIVARKSYGAEILLSDWTLPAVERREAARRKLETENFARRAAAPEAIEAQVIIENDWTLPAFANREAERRARDMERPRVQAAAGRADGPSSEPILTSDWTLAAFKRREEARYWAELVERKRAALQAAGRPEAEMRAADRIQTAPAIKTALEERRGELLSGEAQGEAGGSQPIIPTGERPAALPEAAPLRSAPRVRPEALGHWSGEAPHVAESRAAAPAPELRASYAESMGHVRAARSAGDASDREGALAWAPRGAEADPNLMGLMGRTATRRRLAYGFAALLATGAGLFMARLFFQAEAPAPREATRMERRRPPQTVANPAGGKIPAQRDAAAKKAVLSQPPTDATHSAAPAMPAASGADQGVLAAPPSVDEAARPASPRQPGGQHAVTAPAETTPSATREATTARPAASSTGGSRETPQHIDAKRKPAAAKDTAPEARPKHAAGKVKKLDAGGGETPPAPQAPAAAPQPPATAPEPATAPAPESGSLSGALEKATGTVMDSLKHLGLGGAGQ